MYVFSKASRQVLDVILATPPDLDRTYSTNSIYAAIGESDIPLERFLAIIDNLSDLGFINMASESEVFFVVTESGYSYKDVLKQDFRKFVKEHFVRFVFGFISGIATGILLSWLLGILKLPLP